MAESFFGFDTSLEGDTLDEGIISDDDEDYDALNDETFGGDAVLAGDWEQDHEKLAEITELSRHHPNVNHHQNIINENGDLSAKIAAFILDDDPEPSEKDFDRLDLSTLPRTPRPPPGFSNVTNNNHLKPEVKLPLPPFKNVCTVEEIERNLIKPPANSLRLEDIERNLLPKQSHLINLHHAPGFISVPRHHPLLSNHLQKMPSVAPFPLPAQFPPFALQASAMRIPPPPPLMRLGPGRPVPQSRLPLPPPQLPAPPGDEYAGLMTPKEKQWLASIQLMQLSTNNPFQDDYYYLMFQHRQQGAHGRKGNIKLLQVPSLTKHTYTPLQFENSLGKLQVGSVMAPRKIIDTDVVESVDCPGHGVTALPSSRKIKQLLLEIEHLFSSILLAEEVLSSLATNPPENVYPTEVFTKAVNALLKDDKLRTVLSIRKGKNLVLRILPHTDVSGPLAERLIIVLPTVAKRDTDQTLLRALPAVRHYLATTTLNKLNNLAAHLQPHLTILLENKLGVSVLANMIERAESILTVNPTSEVKETWLKFLSSVVSASCDIEGVERPVVGIPSAVLARHLSRLPPSSHSAILLKAISNTAPS
ncbi:protein PAT1 homolog 1 [Halyomorpha halys]|uniref:protein PAT1 homolog 1 n=1 Tax=Halyomorpha halys TaxID=286706 RepID=UPI0006D4D0AC